MFGKVIMFRCVCNMYQYICMYVGMYEIMYVYNYLCVHMYVYMYVCIYACLCVLSHVNMFDKVITI